MNCCARPRGNETFVGETTMDTADAELTFSTAVPEIAPEVAVMFVLPPAIAFATPAVGDVVLTVATEGLEELQVAVLVRFCVLLSLYVPSATNCWVVPRAIDGFAGVTAIETNAGTTVRVTDPPTEPTLPLTRHCPPLLAAVTSPPGATVHTAGLADAHCAETVRSCVLLLL